MCHLILSLPVFALVVFWVWPLALAGTVYAVVVALSIWMYAIVLHAMRQPVLGGAEELTHSIGEVVEVDGDGLRVRVRSELWNAESADSLHCGERVKVVGITDLTLQVSRFADIDADTMNDVPKPR